MEQARAEIITIGDEILYGQTLDTNAHWISQELDQIGIKVIRRSTIPDIETEILKVFSEASQRAKIIFITGGLGPTKDDLTKPVLCKFFNTHLVFNEEAYQDLERLFAKAKRTISDLNRKQAELPANCEKITNSLGTASGMWFHEDKHIFISMPGVPYEMKKMMTDHILPRLQREIAYHAVVHKMILTIGIAESDLSERISSWEDALPAHLKLAYLPSLGSVKLRLTGTGEDEASIRLEIEDQIQKVKPLINEYIYGYDNGDIEQVIGQMLHHAGKTVACAESCTGGYLAHLITSVPGSSAYFKGGVVAYANEVKMDLLDVEKGSLEKFGAVSEEVAMQMASNVRKKLGSDFGLSISGIAGPGGGTEEKPVGMVWIGYSDSIKTIAKKYYFSKDRLLNIQFGARKALDMLRVNFSGK